MGYGMQLIVGIISFSLLVFSNISHSKDGTYLLLGLNVQSGIKEIRFTGERTIDINQNDLLVHPDYILLKVKPGQYRLTRVKTNNRQQAVGFEKELWTFNIQKEAINYVGHISASRAPLLLSFFSQLYIEQENYSSLAWKYMEANHKDMMLKLPLVYQGPGHDEFFTLMREDSEK